MYYIPQSIWKQFLIWNMELYAFRFKITETQIKEVSLLFALMILSTRCIKTQKAFTRTILLWLNVAYTHDIMVAMIPCNFPRIEKREWQPEKLVSKAIWKPAKQFEIFGKTQNILIYIYTRYHGNFQSLLLLNKPNPRLTDF